MTKIKELKNLVIYWDQDNKELLFERVGNEGIYFAIKKNELYPVQRTLIRIFQSKLNKKNHDKKNV